MDDGRSCQVKESGCLIGNGGCQHECYDQMDGEIICGCRDGYELQKDGKSCKGNSSYSNSYLYDYAFVTNASPFLTNCYEPKLENDVEGCHKLCMNPVTKEVVCKCRHGFQTNQRNRHVCEGTYYFFLLLLLFFFYHKLLFKYYLYYFFYHLDINECSKDNGGCDQICKNTMGSFICECNEGYQLDKDSKNCYDINECLIDNGNCSQICKNTEGGYFCDCIGGYTLGEDGKTCFGKF